MARAVKTKKAKKELTIEEKLEQALVPESEWPYKVPGNWCWTKIDTLIVILNGYAFKSDKYVENGIRIIRIANVQDGYIEDEKPVFYPFDTEKEIEKYILKENDLLISLTGNVGRVAFLDAILLPAALNQRVGCLRTRNQVALSNDFLYYALLRKEFQESCIKNSKGSAQLNMSTEWLKEYPLPLPPLAEQHRIVARIESLFSKLDEAKEKAQAVVDGYEDRKAAILHKAFIGELTESRRINKGVSLDKWHSVTLKDIVSGFKYGTSEKSDYSFSGMPVLRIPNIGDSEIDFSDIKYLASEKVEVANQITENDILIIRSNGSRDLVGKCALVPRLEREYAYASFLIRIKPSERVKAEFLVHFLNSSDARIQMFAKAKSSAGINNINSKELGAITLKLPDIWEQEEIIMIINKLLKEEKQAQEVAEQLIDQIDTMKKSILARAFRGELGTNDPSDESAEELLKRIL